MVRDTSPALAQILAGQAWRNEQRLNAVRIAIWSSVGLITGGAGLFSGPGASPGSVLALLWGALSAVIGLTLLRHRYRGWLATVLSTIDITLLAWCMDAGHHYLLRSDPSLVSHQLYASGIVLMVLLAANALRFSWQLSLWSVAYGTLAYGFVLWRNQAVDVLSYVELMAFGLLGWILAYSTWKLRSIVRQVVERDALTRYLPQPVVDRISQDPGTINLEGESQVVTALFSDLRGFTTMAEDMAPAEVVGMLNEFFCEMAAEVVSHGGIPMQYSGDSLYVVFPEAGGADHAGRAIKAAQGMLRRLEVLNEDRKRRMLPTLDAGIGLHSGPVVGGPIGSPELLQYTYIGDTVNTASRIEHLTREFQHPLLVSGQTLALAGGPDVFNAEPVGDISLRGRREPLPLWAVT